MHCFYNCFKVNIYVFGDQITMSWKISFDPVITNLLLEKFLFVPNPAHPTLFACIEKLLFS